MIGRQGHGHRFAPHRRPSSARLDRPAAGRCSSRRLGHHHHAMVIGPSSAPPYFFRGRPPNGKNVRSAAGPSSVYCPDSEEWATKRGAVRFQAYPGKEPAIRDRR